MPPRISLFHRYTSETNMTLKNTHKVPNASKIYETLIKNIIKTEACVYWSKTARDKSKMKQKLREKRLTYGIRDGPHKNKIFS